MSDLNKKNINYGALNRFYQDLKSHDISTLNDRIDNIDVPEYVAGEGITIDSSSMTISCTVKPITNVSALPDAEVNKDSVLRLESDEKIYVSNITTDSEQIDKAYFYKDDELSYKWYYKGEILAHFADGDMILYRWYVDYGDGDYNEFASKYPATYNYNIIQHLSGGINEVSHFYGNLLFDSLGVDWDSQRQGWYSQNTLAQAESYIYDYSEVYTICLYTIKSQWQSIVTKPELNTFDESVFTGATLTVDGSQPSIVASGTTTIVWDDLTASIPSGKSVEVSVVLINTGNSALTPTMSGNYQMMGDGNLTIQAGELGLYRGRYISALNKWLIEAIYQEVSGVME